MPVNDFIYSSNPNIINEKMDQVFPCVWKPVTLDVPEQHLRIANTIEMRDEFKNGRMKRLKDTFGKLIPQ